MKRTRSNQQAVVVLALLIAVAVLLLGFFLVVRPLTAEGEPDETTGVDTDEGEGVMYGTVTLFDPITRAQMKKITIHNGEGEYSFVRYNSAKTDVDEALATATEGSAFILSEDGEYYPLITTSSSTIFGTYTIDAEKFASLVVATGTTYVRDKIAAADVTADMLHNYGLAPEDDPMWYELETFGGETVRVYVGNQTVSEDAYYMMLEGRDTVYVSNTPDVGDTVGAKSGYYVSPYLSATYVQTGFYYIRNFNIKRRQEAPSYTIGAYDTVYFRGYEEDHESGAETETEYSVDLQYALKDIRKHFVGKHIGDAFAYTVTYPSDFSDEGYAGRTVTFHVQEILTVEAAVLEFSFLNASERDPFYGGVVYQFSAPGAALPYAPDSNVIMDVLESFELLTGTETVEVGVTPEKIQEYGMDANLVSYFMPVSIEYVKDSQGNSTDDVYASNYIPNYLYISDPLEDGSRYVGSLLSDIIAKVDGSCFAFLEKDLFDWTHPAMFAVNRQNVDSTDFRVNFRDMKKEYSFTQKLETYTVTLPDGTSAQRSKTVVTYREENRQIEDPEQYVNLYMELLTINYAGNASLTEEERQALIADPDSCCLTFTLKMNSSGKNKQYVYGFYPYSEREVLVTVNGEGQFYILSSEMKKIALDLERLINGETIDYEKQY